MLSNDYVPLEAWRQSFLIENWEQKSGIVLFQAVRTSKRKYIRWHTGEEEFYNLKSDPFELKNLHENTPRRLKSLLHELEACSGNTCVMVENRGQ